jgi:hypothetical protein
MHTNLMDDTSQVTDTPVTPDQIIPPIPHVPSAQTNQSGHTHVFFFSIIIILLVVVVGFLAYEVYTLKNPQNTLISENVLQLSPAPTQKPKLIIGSPDELKTYTNAQVGVTFKYPSSLYPDPNESKNGIYLAFDPWPNPLPPDSYFDTISVTASSSYSYAYSAVRKAKDGDATIDIHYACGLATTKIQDRKFGLFDAVEYIMDGTHPGDCGRGPIGYEHTILIRRSDTDYIKLVNQSMNPETTKAHDVVFNQILSTLVLGKDATPTIDPTVKTYKNIILKYSVSYPSTYTVSDTSSRAPSVTLYPPGYQKLTDIQKLTAPTITITQNSLASSPQAWVDSLKAPGYSNVRDIRHLTLGGREAVQFTFNNSQAGGGQDQLETEVPLGVNSILSLTLFSSGNIADRDIYHAILMSLSFSD